MSEKAAALARLAGRLREALESGQRIPPPVVDFIDSTFCHPSAESLNALLGDDAHPDADGLRELLLMPEEPLLLEVESLLAGHAWQEEDARGLAERIGHPAPVARLLFPDGRGGLRLRVTPELARSWVARLRMTFRLPAGIEAALSRTGNPEALGRARLLMRQSRLAWTGKNEAFAAALVAALNLAEEKERRDLDYVLDVLSDGGAETPVFDILAERRRLLVNALRRGRRQDELRARLPIEVLASQGVRFAGVDAGETRWRIAALDRASLLVYGRTAAGGEPEVAEALFTAPAAGPGTAYPKTAFDKPARNH
jgi:hypothetical protein